MVKGAAVGERLRAARQARGLSLRDLAGRVGVSASMLSQLENGKSQASVTTLYSLVTELDVSLDELFAPEGAQTGSGDGLPFLRDQAGTPPAPPVHRPGERPVLVMSGGVTWERLTTVLGEYVNAQIVTYPPGSASSSDGKLTRHNGTEFAYLMAGELTLTLGYETHQVRAGDSLAFDSTVPHLYANHGDTEARGVWFELGRHVTGANWPLEAHLRGDADSGELPPASEGSA